MATKADLAALRADVSSDMHSLRTDVAADKRREERDQNRKPSPRPQSLREIGKHVVMRRQEDRDGLHLQISALTAQNTASFTAKSWALANDAPPALRSTARVLLVRSARRGLLSTCGASEQQDPDPRSLQRSSPTSTARESATGRPRQRDAIEKGVGRRAARPPLARNERTSPPPV